MDGGSRILPFVFPLASLLSLDLWCVVYMNQTSIVFPTSSPSPRRGLLRP